MTNLQEFLAGNSPVNPDSRLVLRLAPVLVGAPVTIRWSSVAGKSYTVWKSGNLAQGFQMLQNNVAATPPENTLTDSNPGALAFYIISVP